MANAHAKWVLVGVQLQEPAGIPMDNGYGEWVLVGMGLQAPAGAAMENGCTEWVLAGVWLVIRCLCGVVPHAVWQQQSTHSQRWHEDQTEHHVVGSRRPSPVKTKQTPVISRGSFSAARPFNVGGLTWRFFFEGSVVVNIEGARGHKHHKLKCNIRLVNIDWGGW